MKTIVERFIEEIAYIMDILNNCNPDPKIDPLILFTGSLILTIMTSFSQDLLLPTISLIYSITLIIILRINYKHVIRIEAIIFILGLLPSIPLLFSKTGYINGLNDLSFIITYPGITSFTIFLLRVVIAPLPIVTASIYIGWPALSAAISKCRVLRGIARLISITLTIIPRIIRYTLKLLIAREARIFKYSLGTTWKTLSAITGDLLINSNVYAQKLQLAIDARTLARENNIVVKNVLMNRVTIIYMAFLIALVALWIMVSRNYVIS